MQMGNFIDWDELQTLAHTLSQSSQEGILRSSINRSYYAAFQLCMCFGVFNLNYIRFRDPRDHKAIIDKMVNYKTKSIRKAGRNLDRLSKNRRIADYVESVSVNQSLALTSVKIADNIIGALDIKNL